MTSRRGTIVRPKFQQFSLKQRVSRQAQLSSHWKIKCSIKIQLFTAWGRSHLTWSTSCSRPLLYTTWEATCPLQRSTATKFLESPTLVSQGPTAPFVPLGWASSLHLLRHRGINIIEHHPHTRLSSRHGSNWTPSQKTVLLGKVAQILIYPRPSPCLANVRLCSAQILTILLE